MLLAGATDALRRTIREFMPGKEDLQEEKKGEIISFSHFRVTYVLDWITDTIETVGQTCPRDDSYKKQPRKKDLPKNFKIAPQELQKLLKKSINKDFKKPAPGSKKE